VCDAEEPIKPLISEPINPQTKRPTVTAAPTGISAPCAITSNIFATAAFLRAVLNLYFDQQGMPYKGELRGIYNVLVEMERAVAAAVGCDSHVRRRVQDPAGTEEELTLGEVMATLGESISELQEELAALDGDAPLEEAGAALQEIREVYREVEIATEQDAGVRGVPVDGGGEVSGGVSRLSTLWAILFSTFTAAALATITFGTGPPVHPQ